MSSNKSKKKKKKHEGYSYNSTAHFDLWALITFSERLIVSLIIHLRTISQAPQAEVYHLLQSQSLTKNKEINVMMFRPDL